MVCLKLIEINKQNSNKQKHSVNQFSAKKIEYQCRSQSAIATKSAKVLSINPPPKCFTPSPKNLASLSTGKLCTHFITLCRCDKLYEIKEKSSFRATSFGFGKKYDFTKDASCSPPSNSYTLEDYFRKNVKKGFGFGKGRQEMEITGPFQGYKKNKNPGPGAYALPTMLDKNSFVIRSKLNSSEKAKTQIPGPGSYPASFGISDKGKYYLAKHKSVYAMNFSKSLGRCKTSNQKIPGPGSYDLHGLDLSPKGRYVSSKMGNCPSRSFHGPERKFFGEKTNNPCPGDYRLPSEFGYYEAKKFDKRKQHVDQTEKVQKTQDKQNLQIKRQKSTA